jgi:hypothetical protein
MQPNPNPGRASTALAMALIGVLVSTAGGWAPGSALVIGLANGAMAALLGGALPRRLIVTLGAGLPLASCLLPSGAPTTVPGPYAVMLAMVPVALFGARKAEALAAEQEAAAPITGGTWMTVVIEGDGPRPTAEIGAPLPLPPRRDPERRRFTRRVERREVLVGGPR